MATIYELKEEQQRIVDKLFFLDPNNEQDQEEIKLLEHELNNIQGSAEHKLQFLCTILCEIEANEVARKEVLVKAQKRLKTAENAGNRIRELMRNTMIDFNLKKVEGQYKDVRLQDGREKVLIPEGFDARKLPSECVNHIPESWEPKLRETLKLLKDGVEIEGLEIVRGEKIMVVS